MYLLGEGESTCLVFVGLLVFSNKSLNVRCTSHSPVLQDGAGWRSGLIADDPPAELCHTMATLHEAFDDSETEMGPLFQAYSHTVL